MSDNLIDPFHKLIYAKLSEELATRIEHLVSGSASRISDDTQTVAEKYASQVAYIQALRDVLALCHQIEVDYYGGRPNA